jgi:prepilin-type N-terminal cleavage/methylation domain-containing protein
MNVTSTNRKKGFTIIEVVLVLAIAGLIFLMVFIALPALQRNQRDTARKNEVSKVLSSVTTYQSNNRGGAPSADTTFGKYVDGKMDGAKLTLESGTTISKGTTPTADNTNVSTNVTPDEVIFYMGAKCDDAAVAGVLDRGSNRQAAALIQLENADQVFCQSS